MVAPTLQKISGLEIRNSPPKGRGVFCSEAIAKDTIIEVCPALLFGGADAELIDKTVLYNYYFSATFLPDGSAALMTENKEKAGIIAFGILSFCNHSESPNAHIEKMVDGNSLYFTLRALRDIQPNEEISIAYWKVWFDVV